MEHGRQVIATHRGNIAIWISNNVSYIGELNNGSSQQAAAHFVERAVQAGQQHLKRFFIFRLKRRFARLGVEVRE
jgi:hypothetical protein